MLKDNSLEADFKLSVKLIIDCVKVSMCVCLSALFCHAIDCYSPGSPRNGQEEKAGAIKALVLV